MTVSLDPLRTKFRSTRIREPMMAAAKRVEAELKANASSMFSYGKGTLGSSVVLEETEWVRGFRITMRCDQPHAEWQDKGTGIYGPRGAPIRAKPGGLMVFYWPKVGKTMYLKSVKGSPATHWWTSVIEKWPAYLHEELAKAASG